MKTHTYRARVHWAPIDGEGTKAYSSYSRDHTIGAEGKPEIAASSDPAFRGDPGRYNPEELLLASLASCHMLWYLHLCAANGVTVVSYRDDAFAVMEENADGSGQFVGAELRPSVRLADIGDRSKALALHEKAHRRCFIARSVNFAVTVKPEIL
ncbi:MAG: OsmC family protein [Candidatus Cybelea sp.]